MSISVVKSGELRKIRKPEIIQVTGGLRCRPTENCAGFGLRW